jgi:hypothetical protein
MGSHAACQAGPCRTLPADTHITPCPARSAAARLLPACSCSGPPGMQGGPPCMPPACVHPLPNQLWILNLDVTDVPLLVLLLRAPGATPGTSWAQHKGSKGTQIPWGVGTGQATARRQSAGCNRCNNLPAPHAAAGPVLPVHHWEGLYAAAGALQTPPRHGTHLA